ncbi:MAG: hypothetical protein WKF75_03410 [Singulisphaera sp.]
MASTATIRRPCPARGGAEEADCRRGPRRPPKLAAEATAAPADKKAAAKVAAERRRSPKPRSRRPPKRLQAATAAAAPKDVVEIVTSEPIRLKVTPRASHEPPPRPTPRSPPVGRGRSSGAPGAWRAPSAEGVT